MKNLAVKKISVLSVCFMLLFSLGVQGFERESRENKWKDYSDKIVKKLELSESQADSYKKIMMNRKERKKNHFNEMKTLRENMHKEFLNDPPNVTQIRSIHDKIVKIQVQISNDHLEHKLSVRKMLSKDQFEKMNDIHRKKMKKEKEKWEKKMKKDKK